MDDRRQQRRRLLDDRSGGAVSVEGRLVYQTRHERPLQESGTLLAGFATPTVTICLFDPQSRYPQGAIRLIPCRDSGRYVEYLRFNTTEAEDRVCDL